MSEKKLNLTVTSLKHPVLEGLAAGSLLKGSLYSQSVSPLENQKIEILATSEQGQPCIVSTHYGKGEAMLAGSYLGMANFPEVEPNNDIFFTNLLKWAMIERPFTTSLDGRTSSQVEVRLQDNPNGYVVFVINHSNGTEEISIDLKVKNNVSYKIKDLISNTEASQKGANNLLKLSTSLERKQVRVWEITGL